VSHAVPAHSFASAQSLRPNGQIGTRARGQALRMNQLLQLLNLE
jgi:hypothetical protein